MERSNFHKRKTENPLSICFYDIYNHPPQHSTPNKPSGSDKNVGRDPCCQSIRMGSDLTPLLPTSVIAAQSGETRGTASMGIDRNACTRSVPATRMKAANEHPAPPPNAAFDLPGDAGQADACIFGSRTKPSRPISDMCKDHCCHSPLGSSARSRLTPPESAMARALLSEHSPQVHGFVVSGPANSGPCRHSSMARPRELSEISQHSQWTPTHQALSEAMSGSHN